MLPGLQTRLPYFFRGWIAPCLAEGSGFGSSRPGPSVGTAEASLPPSQLANSALETRMSQRQYVADRQRREHVRQGVGSHGSITFVFCPQRGEEKESCKHLPNCLLPRLLLRFPSRRTRRPKKRLKSSRFVCLKASRKGYLLTNSTVPTLVSSAPRAFFESAYGKGKNGNVQSLSW